MMKVKMKTVIVIEAGKNPLADIWPEGEDWMGFFLHNNSQQDDH